MASLIRNVHVYPSNITNESRILKEARSIAMNGLVDELYIIGFWRQGLPRKESVSHRVAIVRFNCYVGKIDRYKLFNAIPFLVLYAKLVWFCIRNRVQIVNCHTLTLLPACAFIKLVTGAKLIYDPHELETETHDSRGIRQKMSRLLEQSLIRFADQVIVVGDSIKEWYEKRYRLNNVHVVKNIPSLEQQEIGVQDLKGRFGVADHEILFIYQGYLSASRGVDNILKVFEKASQDKHIVFMGYGPLEDRIKVSSASAKNIHYLPAAKPSEILGFTAAADIGIHIIPNTCLNHYYCLPNKVFEYLLAGVPFIVSNFPDIRREFESRDVAWFVEPGEESLAHVVKTVTPETVRRKKQNCVSSRSVWRWENQDPVYVKVYGLANQSNSVTAESQF